jgi:hypothetical protein
VRGGFVVFFNFFAFGFAAAAAFFFAITLSS